MIFIRCWAVAINMLISLHGHIFPYYWPFLRGTHLPPMDSIKKGQLCEALKFSFLLSWITYWANSLVVGDSIRHDAMTLMTLMGAHGHYCDVKMTAITSQITSLTSVYSSADQRKHQSSASLDFVRGSHRWPVNSPHKRPVMRKMFPFDDVIMFWREVTTVGEGWTCFGDFPNLMRFLWITFLRKFATRRFFMGRNFRSNILVPLNVICVWKSHLSHATILSLALTLVVQGPQYSWRHDDVIKWKHFPRYWSFMRGIHRSPVNSPHKGPE